MYSTLSSTLHYIPITRLSLLVFSASRLSSLNSFRIRTSSRFVTRASCTALLPGIDLSFAPQQVFETIRTPGHFYLVEENLRSSVTLEQLVASSPGGILPLNLAWSVLEQLASVVRSLHQPLRVCHRDIKVRLAETFAQRLATDLSASPRSPRTFSSA